MGVLYLRNRTYDKFLDVAYRFDDLVDRGVRRIYAVDNCLPSI